MGNFTSSGNVEYMKEDKAEKEQEIVTTPTKKIAPFDPRSPSISINRTPIQIEITPPKNKRCKDLQSNTPNQDDNTRKPRSPLKLIDPDSPKHFLRYKQVRGLHKELKRNGYDIGQR